MPAEGRGHEVAYLEDKVNRIVVSRCVRMGITTISVTAVDVMGDPGGPR